jgi:adenosylcobinamide kinase/adenosylcobinamide-phosphate guanylyltransferase
MALVVITGGARSGKSRAAEQLAKWSALDGARVTVAVFGSESDAEMTDRIAHHRSHRPDGFETLPAADSRTWLSAVSDDTLLVVDCLGTCLGRAMLEVWDECAAAGADM